MFYANSFTKMMTQHPNQNFEPATQAPRDPQEKPYRNSRFHFGQIAKTWKKYVTAQSSFSQTW